MPPFRSPAPAGRRFVPRVDALEPRLTPTARLQLLNASPYAAGSFFDVYVNNVLVRDGLPYGQAIPFVSVPSGTPVRLDIARGDSTRAGDAFASVVRTFPDDTDALFVAVGDPGQPANSPTAFAVREFTPARSVSTGGQGTADILVVNASPDTPAFDLAVRDKTPFVSGVGPRQFAPGGYVTLPAERVNVDFFPTGADAPTKSYDYNLAGFAGTALTLAAIGFSNPVTVGSGNVFQLVSVGADGQVLNLPTTVLPARLQLFNNDPFPAFRSLDVYVNDTKVADDLAFRAATPFLTIPANQTVRIDFSRGTAADNSAPLFSTTVQVPSGTAQFAMLTGNPQAGTGTQQLRLVATTARLAADSKAVSQLLFAQGAADAPPIDVKRRGVGTLGDDVPTNGFDLDGYLPVTAVAGPIDVTGADGVSRLGSFNLDLSNFGGRAGVLATTGFLSPAAGDPAFGLVLVPVTGGAGTVLTAAAPFAPPTGFVAGGSFGGAPQVRRFGPTGAALSPVPVAGVGSPRVTLIDVNADGVPDTVIGTGPGQPTGVTVRDGRAPDTVIAQFQPFEASFTGGVYVSGGDLDGDGRAEIVVTPDQGGGPRVDVYTGAGAKLTSFFGIDDANFRGGARSAVGDVNADGRPELLVTAGFGGGPRASLYDGRTVLAGTRTRLVPDLFAFENTLRNGVFGAVGDIDNDGFGDLIFGAGPGGGPRVLGLSGRLLLSSGGALRVPVANFFAGDALQRLGVSVAVADLDGDYQADVVAGLPGSGPQVRAFPGRTLAPGEFPPPASIEASPFDPAAGVFVG